jgi:hypothetical protein
MVRRVAFIGGEELVLLLPIDSPSGELLEVERWPFNEVVAELERVAEAAARGEKWANRVYQRLVYSLRAQRLRRAEGDGDVDRSEGMGADHE